MQTQMKIIRKLDFTILENDEVSKHFFYFLKSCNSMYVKLRYLPEILTYVIQDLLFLRQ